MSLAQALKKSDNADVLWVRGDSIGDSVVSISMLAEIKKTYPTLKITVLCQHHISELYEACPHTDHIITFDKKRACEETQYRDVIVSSVRQLKPLFALNSVYSREPITDIFTLQSGAKYTAAFSGNTCNITEDERDANNALYTDIIISEGSHKIEFKRYNDFLRALGINVSGLKSIVYTTPGDEIVAEEIFNRYGLKNNEPIAILPSAQCTYRIYPRFSEVMEVFRDFPLIIAGGSDMIALGRKLSENFTGTCIDLTATTSLRQTASVLRKSRLAICSESAAAHMACAVGTPNVVILGGGHMGRFFPYSNLTSAVSLPLNCYGCNWICKYEGDYHCISDIAPESIVFAAKNTLKGLSQNPKIYLQGGYLNPKDKTPPPPGAINKFVSDVEIINLTLQSYKNMRVVKPTGTVKQHLPEITVVTPSYNQAAYLEQCIVSVINQNYPNLQYIIMDGGSTDGSVEIIKRYEKYISHWRSAPDDGQYGAINDGFKLATGEIMGWINSDDKFHSGALWNVAKVFMAYRDVQWVMGRPTVWAENGDLADMLDPIPQWCRGYYLEGKIGPPHIQQESTFWRTSLWERAGGYLDRTLKYAGDLELWARFFRHAQLYSVDALIGGFRARGNQKTSAEGIDSYNSEAERILNRERELIKQTAEALLPPPEILSVSSPESHLPIVKENSLKIHVSFSGLGAGNIGDEAMMLGFLSLYKLPPATTIEVWDKNEPALKVFPEYYEFVDYTDTLTCQSLCLSADCVFVIGATIVTEMLSTDWPLRVLGDKYDFCFTHGIEVHAIGTGVDMLVSEEGKNLFYKGFSGINSWTVRSERSRRVLIGLGINPSDVVTTADLAWLTPLDDINPVWAKDYLASTGIDMGKPLIGINVVNEKWLNQSHIKEQLAAALDELIDKHGFVVAFFCNETREGQYFDKEASLSVISLMQHTAILVPNNYYTPAQMISMLTLCRFTISWRYHFTVFSILAGSVPITVMRGDKLIELVNEFNGLNLGKPERISKVKILDAILKGEANYNKIKLNQKIILRALKQRSRLNTTFIRNLNVHSLKSVHVNKIKPLKPSLLWVRLDSIGDALLSMGMLPEIRKKYEGYQITVLCQEHVKELYETCPFVDNIIGVNKQLAACDELYRNKIIKALRDLNPIVALNSQCSREPLSDFFTIESAAKEKIAFFGDSGNNFPVDKREINNPAYTHIIETTDRNKPELKRHEEFLRAIGIENPVITPALWSTPDDEHYADLMFTAFSVVSRKLIVVAPGSQYNYKVYERFHEALEGLHDYDICVLGGGDATETALKIKERFKGRTFDLTGKTTLRQMAAMIRRSAVFVGTDSIAAHMACVYGIPNVVVLGGGHPGRFIPYHPATTAVSLPLNCYGCNWNCRYGTYYCVKSITPETANSAIKKALSEVSLYKEKPEIIFESPSAWNSVKKMPVWRLPEGFINFDNFKISWGSETPQKKEFTFNKTGYSYLVTAIVSAYKSERFIRQCLMDLCNQTIGDELEIIIVDAASPENEKTIVEEFQRLHHNITYIRTGSRIGVYSAWNLMVKLARGKYITPMSTNDRLRSDAYEILAGYLEQFHDIALVYGNTFQTKHPNESFELHTVYNDFSWPEFSYEQLLQIPMVGPHPMWRAAVHNEIGFFDESYVANGDQEFFLRLGLHHELMSVPEYTGLYWLAPDALSVAGKTPAMETQRAHRKYQQIYAQQMRVKLTKSPVKRPIYIWGCGQAGEITLSVLSGYNIVPAGFVDRDCNKWGSVVKGLTVYSPEEKVLKPPDAGTRPFIIIASVYAPEIIRDLNEAGYVNRKDYFTNIYALKWI
ncbi:MAG: glycosyltransferase [Nitrospirae bacterium YQR-1]